MCHDHLHWSLQVPLPQALVQSGSCTRPCIAAAEDLCSEQCVHIVYVISVDSCSTRHGLMNQLKVKEGPKTCEYGARMKQRSESVSRAPLSFSVPGLWDPETSMFLMNRASLITAKHTFFCFRLASDREQLHDGGFLLYSLLVFLLHASQSDLLDYTFTY